MSILVWDGETLACDSASNDGATKTPLEKMWRYKDIVLAGVGSLHDISAMREWVLNGRKTEKFPSGISDGSHFVVVTPARGLVRYTTKPYAIIHGFNKCAFGTGRDIAYGAIFMGADAVHAVKAAIHYGVTCGLDVLKETIVTGETNAGVVVSLGGDRKQPDGVG